MVVFIQVIVLTCSMEKKWFKRFCIEKQIAQLV